jgi:hypothetical protein
MPLWLPLVLFLTLWIKLASPGPVFFRQEHIGHRGKRFMILKFRTMKVNVETRTYERHLAQRIKADSPMTKLDAADDPRIIPGSALRRLLCLDELPQIFNARGNELGWPASLHTTRTKNYQMWQRERVSSDLLIVRDDHRAMIDISSKRTGVK